MSDIYDGRVLYHYTDEQALLKILQTGRIWATDIQALADETEVEHGRDLVAKRLELKGRQDSRLSECAWCTKALPDMPEMIRRAGKTPAATAAEVKWYVACFSQSRDALPLWRMHNCEGYALGFCYKHGETIQLSDLLEPRIHASPKQVYYPCYASHYAVRNTVDEVRRSLDEYPDGLDWTIALGEIFTMKSPVFSSEQEWRVVYRQRAPLYPEVKSPFCHVELPLSDWELVEVMCGPRSKLRTASQIEAAIGASTLQPKNVTQSAIRLRR